MTKETIIEEIKEMSILNLTISLRRLKEEFGVTA